MDLDSKGDFFDVIEFLYQNVSKPIDGNYHSYNECGTHWSTFNRAEGQAEFRDHVNRVLEHYEKRFELSANGEVLHKPESGFEPIFGVDVASSDQNITARVHSVRFRRHGSRIIFLLKSSAAGRELTRRSGGFWCSSLCLLAGRKMSRNHRPAYRGPRLVHGQLL